jgi:UDP-N-acetylmuramate: L-alanyl-gamma-D-glutamyl-meso-diaminopimelate ligase
VSFGTDADHGPVNALLAGHGLPEISHTDSLETLVMGSPDGVVGCVSVDIQGDYAFLFGLAVSPERRGEGLGWVLGDCVMRHARTLGARRVYLSAAGAADFFASKLGFRQIDASDVDPVVAETPNFSAAAGLTGAVCMVFDLPEDGPLSSSP